MIGIIYKQLGESIDDNWEKVSMIGSIYKRLEVSIDDWEYI